MIPETITECARALNVSLKGVTESSSPSSSQMQFPAAKRDREMSKKWLPYTNKTKSENTSKE